LLIPTKKRNGWETRIESFGVGGFAAVGHAHHHQKIQKAHGHIAGAEHALRRAKISGALDITVFNPTDGIGIELGILQFALELPGPANF
jgi:hypothetical protein